jgi:hypothetical protein
MNSDLMAMAVLTAGFLVVLALVFALTKRRRRPLNKAYFLEKWQEYQKLCATKETWPLVVINTDKLLDEALKKAGYRGRTMGERLVAAQRDLSDNDAVWFGHKLRNKLVHESDMRLREDDVKDALKGIRQALRDLGAL